MDKTIIWILLAATAGTVGILLLNANREQRGLLDARKQGRKTGLLMHKKRMAYKKQKYANWKPGDPMKFE